jgi:phage baseplate assembly protein gpV
MQFKRLLCSTCGTDLIGNALAIKTKTCENGHVMGMGLSYIRADGLADFLELSLVSKGASNGAKILGAQKRLLASTHYEESYQLAASFKDLELTLFGSPTELAEEDPMLIAELQAKLTKAEGDLTLTATAKTEAEGKVAVLEAAKVTLEADKVTLEAAKTEAEGKVAVLEAAKTEADTQLAALQAAKTEADAAKVVLEAAKTEAEAKLLAAETELAPLKAAQTATLTQRPFKLPMGGVANLNTTTTDSEKPKTVTTGSNAFRTPK